MDLSQRYQHVRKATESICSPLAVEDHVPQPALFVSPPKWHLAHTTWFFETFILREYVDDYVLFDETFPFLFNSYYNTLGPRTDRAHRGNMSRPILEKVLEYRSYVDEHVTGLLQQDGLTKELTSLIEIGIQHEQQHQELLWTDLKYILGNQPTFPV